MEIVISLPQIFESSITWWQHLNISCPQYDPTKGVANLNTSHETT